MFSWKPYALICLVFASGSVTAKDYVEGKCDYSTPAEILDETYARYGSLFTGGNHYHVLESAAGSADLFRLLKDKKELGFRDIRNYDVDCCWDIYEIENKSNSYDGFEWILERFKSNPDKYYLEAFVDADLHNVVDINTPIWMPDNANEEGKEFLTWLGLSIKSSGAPWNYLPQYADQYEHLWPQKYASLYDSILEQTPGVDDLPWFVLQTELLPFSELELGHKELYENLDYRVQSCKANDSEYAAWAIASTKFLGGEVSLLQVEYLPRNLLINSLITYTRTVAHGVSTGNLSPSELVKLEELSQSVPKEFSYIPLVPLIYLSDQESLPSFVSNYLANVQPQTLAEYLLASHLFRRLDSADTPILAEIYKVLPESYTKFKMKFNGVLAARYFLEDDFGRALQHLDYVIQNDDEKTSSYDLDYAQYFDANIPKSVKAATLVLALDEVTNWISYEIQCFRCYDSKKDIPSMYMGENSKAINDHNFKVLLGDPKKQKRSIRGYYADTPLDRAHNSDRPDIRGDSWYEEPAYILDDYDLPTVQYSDLTPVMKKASEIILPWASRDLSKWKWDLSEQDILKALSLNALIYATKSNPTLGVEKNPSHEAWLLVDEYFDDLKHFDYWYAQNADSYLEKVVQ